MERTQTMSNKTFTIKIDKPDILDKLEYQKSEFQRIKDSGADVDQEYIEAYVMPDGSNFMTQDEYESAYDSMIDFVKNMTDSDLDNLLSEWPRKKNGTLNRRPVKALYSCNASRYICEWHNTWIFTQLRVKAVDDTHLEVNLHEMVDTPA